MSWTITPAYRGAAVSDPDAQTYLRAVEAADGQALEQGVQQAVNQFVIGCKADGIWPAIKASCILAGARTLSGALVPLAGTAPTNFNFVSGDYNRKTGLVGNKSTKYLETNRLNSADPQNSRHFSCYGSFTVADGTYNGIYGCNYTATGWTGFYIDRRPNPDVMQVASLAQTGNVILNSQNGFMGMSRFSSTSVSGRNGGVSNIVTVSSQAPTTNQLRVFAAADIYDTAGMTNGRLAFYSIGEALDLALLDSRVTALITAFGTAIP
jgi:hypothetical protein